eukprot:gnl/Hemi2/9398_TR3270_c0_g1_i1.p1 gnl/Hemi2/9398_TR3270_c0_g1~~gnl/Hemi2/9398_TR3270_c0_g1_i1.p1  ORF type:complete len:301 (-),score=103.19 gnl/Hemi2/9398_TR3270_c0_g1_i1:110-1012(-)
MSFKDLKTVSDTRKATTATTTPAMNGHQSQPPPPQQPPRPLYRALHHPTTPPPTSPPACTCNRCIDGWLSPRLQLRLRVTADVCVGVIRDILHSAHLPAGSVINPREFLNHLNHIPRHLREPSEEGEDISDGEGTNSGSGGSRSGGLTKMFIQGLIQCYDNISACLRAGKPPYPSMVERLWSVDDTRTAEYFRNNGGRPEFALAHVVDQAIEESAAFGDGTFDEMFGSDLDLLCYCSNDNKLPQARERLLGANYPRVQDDEVLQRQVFDTDHDATVAALMASAPFEPPDVDEFPDDDHYA